MDSNQFEAMFLIETKGMQIIVCCNKEYTLATLCARLFSYLVNEHCTDTLSFVQTIEGDDLAITSGNKISDLPNPLLAIQSNKSIQGLRPIEDPMCYETLVP